MTVSGLVPTQVVIVRGSNQTTRAGTALATHVVVRVLGPNIVPMVGIPVAVTHTAGEVSLRWTIGTTAGATTALIQVCTLDPVTISAAGTP